MAWVEVTSKRRQKEKHYRDSENPRRFRAEITIHDQHYKDSGDAWQDVDESLVDDGQGGFHKKCDKTRHIFRVAGGGVRRWYPQRNVVTEYVDISDTEYWDNDQVRWRKLNFPAAIWKKQGGEWETSNLIIRITNTWRRIKTEFVLKDATAPTRLRFAVAFTGLTYNADTGELTSTTDGLVWGYINKPTAQDTNEADIPITAFYDGTYIEWSADTSGAIYPVMVDPTFTDGYGGDVDTAKDTMVFNDGTGTPPRTERNYGTETSWTAHTKMLAEFDLSSITATSTCDSATIYMYQTASGAAQAFTVTIYSIASGNDAWIEGTGSGGAVVANAGEPCWEALAADGAGGVTTAWAGSAGLSTSGTDYEASSIGSFSGNRSDANGTEYTAALTTSRVEDWFGSPNTNYGILLVRGLSFGGLGTSNNATTGYRPKLVVEYTTTGGTILTVQDSAHSHSAESKALAVSASLAVGDTAHGHAVESKALTVDASLAVADTAHAHTVESPNLTASSSLAVADALHAHHADNVTFPGAGELAESIFRGMERAIERGYVEI